MQRKPTPYRIEFDTETGAIVSRSGFDQHERDPDTTTRLIHGPHVAPRLAHREALSDRTRQPGIPQPNAAAALTPAPVARPRRLPH